ncbi:hypothetical protein [Paraflavitalea speifideaquila]|uniref:hypothetical protein n=1 Tax=Paraflavitalea speifideaquila TaxID=3076558 RepID=UPI0028E25425|nr:hypothetical protein [Paraflavitalea speifideiaquila]
MAKVIAGIGTGIIGTLDELSFYRMKGVDKTIVRRKGGHTKEKVKNMPGVKKAISEFSGRSTASKYLRSALCTQVNLAGRNLAGTINALMLPVQENDQAAPFGKRNINLSSCPHILTGFSLNKTDIFDSIVRYPLSWSLQKETGTATVHLPELVPGLSLVSQETHPYYRFKVTLGVMPDLKWTKSMYMPVVMKYQYGAIETHSTWYPLLEGSPALDLSVIRPDLPAGDQYTLVLTVGICYGIVQGTNHIAQAPNAGSAKILEVV